MSPSPYLRLKNKNEKFASFRNTTTFATAIEKQTMLLKIKSSGCSAVRLAHLVWDQGVPGSNPGTPTK